MKKQFLILAALVFSAGLLFNSCKEHKGEHSEEHNSGVEHASEKADMALNDLYQCPMNCEDGKTYDEEGTCPVCAMKLKKLEGKHKHEDGDVHNDHGEGDSDETHKEDHDTEGEGHDTDGEHS